MSNYKSWTWDELWENGLPFVLGIYKFEHMLIPNSTKPNCFYVFDEFSGLPTYDIISVGARAAHEVLIDWFEKEPTLNDVNNIIKAPVLENPCECPLYGATGLLAVGCLCGGK